MRKVIFLIVVFVFFMFSMQACIDSDVKEDSSDVYISTESREDMSSYYDDPSIESSSDGGISENNSNEESVADTITGDSMLLYVDGVRLKDAKGNNIQLRGISSHGLSWFPDYINRELMQQMKDEWGCNVFRLAMYTADYNGYCTGDENNRIRLKGLIDDAVKYTEELGMYIIIDWHILSDNNPFIYREEALSFFDETAEKYSDKTHVIYEICNEPNGGVDWKTIKLYADEVIPVIRKHTDAVILVGTPNWCQEITKVAEAPLEHENIMYTLHFYAATHKDNLRNQIDSAILDGIPVFVSEFGICDASGGGAIDIDQANKWVAKMDDYGISYVMWNLSNKNESSAIISASCAKTSGFVFDDLSDAGKWFVTQR